MRTLLEWLNAAESAEQKQIVRKCAERGLTLGERRRLTELVASATGVESPANTVNATEADARDAARTSVNVRSADATDTNAAGTSATGTDERVRALLELYDWYSDWFATARALIKRRDHRCALGIGEKRAKGTAVGP